MRNSKNVIKVILVAAVTVCLLVFLDFALYPCTFIRNDIHAVSENTYQDIYMGASYGKINIDPSTIEDISGRTGHNLCVGGEYTMDTYYLVKLMCERGHAPERIIYEVSPAYFTREKEEGNNFLLFYHEFSFGMTKLDYFFNAVSDCNLRTLFFPWYEYPLNYEISHMQETMQRKWNRDYSAEGMSTASQEYHEDGFIERYPVDPESFTLDGLYEIWPEDILPENMDYLAKTIELCKENGIEFIGISTPLAEPTLEAFGEGDEALWAYFGDFFEQHGVQYINFNDDAHYDLTDHSVENYTDLDGHMNGDAARAFSRVLAKVLNPIG